jgi:O-antigen ligase
MVKLTPEKQNRREKDVAWILNYAQIIRRNYPKDAEGIQTRDRLLMSLLFITSLFPSIILHDSILRYGPPFTVLFIVAIVAVLDLRDSRQRDHLTSFMLANKLHVAVVGLYITVITVSALIVGTLRDAPYVLGSILTISVFHIYLPLAVREERDFFFLMKLLFIVGTSNAAAALVLLVLKWFYGYGLGVFPVGQFGTNKLTVLEQMHIPYVMKGLFWHPNFLGILLSFMLPSGLFLAHRARALSHRLLYAAGSVMSCITIAGAFAFISLLPTFLTLTLFPVITKRRITALLSLFVVLSVLAVNVVVLGGIDLTLLKSLPVTSIGRVDRWNTAIPLIRGHAFFGVGPSNAAGYLPNGLSAHNTFIDIALGNGLPAMMLYSAFFILLTIKTGRSGVRSLSAFMMLTLLSFFLLQFFETQLFGGMSIANFYFLIVAVSYLSISSSWAMQEEHIGTACG